MIHDGRFLQSDFVFDSPAGTTTGMGLIGFESASGKFTSVWSDSRQTRMSFRQSRDKFNGEEIVLYGSSLDPPAADSRRSAHRIETRRQRQKTDSSPILDQCRRRRTAGYGTAHDEKVADGEVTGVSRFSGNATAKLRSGGRP